MLEKVRDVLARVTTVLEAVECVILVIVMAGAVFVGFWQVLARFVFKSSLHWSEESMLMGFVWVTFIGAALGVSRGTHLCVDFFVDRLPKRLGHALCLTAHILTVAFSVVAFCLSVMFFLQSYRKGQLSAAMEIPMIIPYSGMVAAFGFMIVQATKVTLDYVLDIREQRGRCDSPEAGTVSLY